MNRALKASLPHSLDALVVGKSPCLATLYLYHGLPHPKKVSVNIFNSKLYLPCKEFSQFRSLFEFPTISIPFTFAQFRLLVIFVYVPHARFRIFFVSIYIIVLFSILELVKMNNLSLRTSLIAKCLEVAYLYSRRYNTHLRLEKFRHFRPRKISVRKD